jgi:NADP-dependent alcohol dehydrogenase
MYNFELYNPVKLIFGKGQIAKISENISKDKKILLTYGGGSIKNNGVYDQVISALEGYQFIEFSGIEANPQFSTLMKAVEICRSEKIEFILAVGGGSVIDGTKFISAAVDFKGDEWDILANGGKVESAIPFGTVLTLPATGSEMNSGAVVSRKEIDEKRSFGSPLCFPVFSISDPTVVASLPDRQLRNGVVDAYVHVLEQYLTFPNNAPLQDRFAESILQTLIEVGPKVINEPANYEHASNLMWCATMALNGLIGKGVPNDWATHMIGHELTSEYNMDHGQTLAIVGPNLYEKLFDSKKEKLAQYGRRVFGLSGADEQVAKDAIAKTREFFSSVGMKNSISEFEVATDGFSDKVKSKFVNRGWTKIGEKGLVTPDVAKEIVEMSI